MTSNFDLWPWHSNFTSQIEPACHAATKTIVQTFSGHTHTQTRRTTALTGPLGWSVKIKNAFTRAVEQILKRREERVMGPTCLASAQPVCGLHICPSPIRPSVRWDSGARSPLAPTVPFSGTHDKHDPVPPTTATRQRLNWARSRRVSNPLPHVRHSAPSGGVRLFTHRFRQRFTSRRIICGSKCTNSISAHYRGELTSWFSKRQLPTRMGIRRRGETGPWLKYLTTARLMCLM